MAYTAGTLHLRGGEPGSLVHYHDAGSDTMATVLTAGYFNNTDDSLNLTVDDLVFSQCTDGDMWHKVASLSSGAVTSQLVSGLGPWNGLVIASGALSVGISELSGSATAVTLPTPYVGARVTVYQSGAGTGTTVITDATTETINSQGDRTITFSAEFDSVDLVGVSTTRWAVIGSNAVTSA